MQQREGEFRQDSFRQKDNFKNCRKLYFGDMALFWDLPALLRAYKENLRPGEAEQQQVFIS